MNHFVALNNLFNYCFGFLFVHLPHFADPVVVAFFKTLVLLLKFLEHLGEALKLFRALYIFPLEFCEFLSVFLLDFSYDVSETAVSHF
jgi:hypothetical protein